MWQANPYAILLFVGLVPVLSFAVIAWRHRSSRPAQFFFAYTIVAAGLMLTYALELLSAQLSLMLVWLKLEYLFSLSTPVIWLLLVIAYCGYDNWITWRRVALLFAIPALHLLLVWTNEYHGLNWQTVGTTTVNGMVLFSRTYGPAFYIGTGYLYLVAVAAISILFTSFLRAPHLYRRQMALIFLAVGLMWLGNLLTILRLTIVPNLDLTPFGYALASVPLAWSLLHFRLLDIMPAAHRQIIHVMSDAVIVLDAQERLIEANPAAERLLNLKAANVIGKPISALIPSHRDVIERFRGVTNQQDELTIGSGETRRTYDFTISALQNRAGQLTGRVVVLREVTRLKQAEAAARHYAAELEQRNQELDAFSHTIAHDLKGPLSGVMGYADILLMFEINNLTPQGRVYAAEIARSARKMEQMITELLRLASLRNLSDSLVTVDMQLTVEAALTRLRHDIDQRGVAITIEPDLPPALGQALWVEEVLANLVSNAVKYIGKDNPQPWIRIGGCRMDDLVRYEVQDNGLGIAPEDQASLFEMFARFHTGEASGLGLGLSIVLRIVNRLGGQVGVESEPGQGSTFWFTLPAVAPDTKPLPVAV